jgi:hypothetical protein
MITVYETTSPKGNLMLRTHDDARVAYYVRDEGWLLLDDRGNARVTTRQDAEAFVAGALGNTKALLPKRQRAIFVLIIEKKPWFARCVPPSRKRAAS